jgi:hypothetical protein
VLGRSFTQQLIFGRSYFAGEWHQQQFLSNLYSESSREEEIYKTLSGIHQQKSVVRIQQKLALSESLLDHLQGQEEKQLSILHAALSAQEWQQDQKQNAKNFDPLALKSLKPITGESPLRTTSSKNKSLKRGQVRLYLVPSAN